MNVDAHRSTEHGAAATDHHTRHEETEPHSLYILLTTTLLTVTTSQGGSAVMRHRSGWERDSQLSRFALGHKHTDSRQPTAGVSSQQSAHSTHSTHSTQHTAPTSVSAAARLCSVVLAARPHRNSTCPRPHPTLPDSTTSRSHVPTSASIPSNIKQTNSCVTISRQTPTSKLCELAGTSPPLYAAG